MITGYNTDVSHAERVFHVQTEDKGVANPCIESLIYVGGRVLSSRRTEYGAILAQGQGDEAIVEMMDRQHRSMITAIRDGEFDAMALELLGAPTRPAAVPAVTVERPRDRKNARQEAAERSLDEVILDYLTAEAEQEHLVLTMDEPAILGPGENGSFAVRAATSRGGEALEGVEVTVRLISTVAEPRVLTRGVTDAGGVLRVELDVPEATQGTSALIISAGSALGQAELKVLL